LAVPAVEARAAPGAQVAFAPLNLLPAWLLLRISISTPGRAAAQNPRRDPAGRATAGGTMAGP
ncbi:MAG: hypothetical protein ACK53J_11945, partial [Betaproteobacteria bacterium]